MPHEMVRCVPDFNERLGVLVPGRDAVSKRILHRVTGITREAQCGGLVGGGNFNRGSEMKSKSAKCTIAASLMALASGGCAELNSIERVNSIPAANDGGILTVDAKQRHLIMSRVGEDHFRVCAEAAPDVFSALASSGSLTLDAAGSGSGQGGFSLSETAATIERTQTINMLRESFYRTCERYLSGALTKSQFIIQAARDQRVMTSILAIEQLTGAVRPPSTIISGPGTQASAFSGARAAELVEDYRERLKVAEKALTDAEATAKAAKNSDGSCKDGKDCVALDAKVASAKTDRDKAQAGLDNAVAVANNLTSAANASTSSGTNSSSGTQAAQFDAQRIAAVSRAVVEIHRGATINEALMFCIAVMSGTEAPNNAFLTGLSGQKLTDTCQDILKQSANRDDQYLLDGAKLDLLEKVKSDPSAPGELLGEYLDQKLPSAEYTRRMGIATTAADKLGFGDRPSDVRAILFGGRVTDQIALVAAIRTRETNSNALKDLGAN